MQVLADVSRITRIPFVQAMTRRAGAFALTVAVAGIAAGDGSAVQDRRRDVCGPSGGQSVGIVGPATPPFGPALQLRHVGAARMRIAFVPRFPAGKPFRVYVSRERELRLRRLGLAYRSSPSRWFQLTQGRLFVSVARFEQSLRELAARDLCGARSSTFRLRNGTLALLTEAADRRLVVFRHQGLELMLLTSPAGSSAARLVALANSLTEQLAAIELWHRFDMRELPYPEGVLYTVSIRRATGKPPRFQRAWGRFWFDASYSGSGLAGKTKLGELRLRPGAYVVSGSAKPCADPNGGCSTLGSPQDRCSRRVEVRAARGVRITVFAKSGQRCSISVTAR